MVQFGSCSEGRCRCLEIPRQNSAAVPPAGSRHIRRNGPSAAIARGRFVAPADGFFVNELRLLDHVAGAEEQDAFAGQSVAARAAGFLVIALDVFRQIVVDDEADVRLVDAHAEGDGRADHPHVVAQEKFLMLACAASG